MDPQPLVRMVGIVKRFGDVLANDHVNFELWPGEVHALLGENGAGKTTLMNVLYGLYRADEGEIYVKGRRVKVRSPRDAIALGIGMVHQHFLLVDRLTVAENLALGFAKSFLNPVKEVKRKAEEIMKRYGLEVNLDAYVWQLSLGEQQRVEILKALYAGADILILDEPTSVLTPSEAEGLFKAVKRMREAGKGVVFITHKLDEVMRVADRVTVMRKGRVVGTLKVKEVTKEKLARMMVGRDVLFRFERRKVRPGAVLLEVRDLHVLGDRGEEAVRGVSFQLREGEILAIAGVSGNGQRELAQALVGLRKPVEGFIKVTGRDVTGSSPKEVVGLGVAYIPEERLRYGVVPGMNVAENTVLKDYREPPIRNGFTINGKEVLKRGEELVKEFDVKVNSIEEPASQLSGGNVQKLVVGRELSRNVRVVVAVNPTQGLDVGATERVRRLLLEMRDRGAGVLLISGDLDEVLQLADRVLVMFSGKLVPVEADREAIAVAMGQGEGR